MRHPTALPGHPGDFVSGGGGRYLYDYKPSAFDEVGLSEHHFMVAEISSDRLFFEAITHTQRVIDCGVIYRLNPKPDDDTKKWMSSCDEARARPRTTAEQE